MVCISLALSLLTPERVLFADIIKRLYANSADLSVVTPQLVVTYLTKLQASAVGKQLRLNFTGAIQQAEDVVLLVKRDRKDGMSMSGHKAWRLECSHETPPHAIL